MSWLDAAPGLLVAVVLLLAPGALVGAAGGVRGVLVPALAPALSVAVVATGAVAASFVGLPFGLAVVAAATVLTAAVVLAARVLGGRWLRQPPAARDGWRVVAAAGAGVVAGAVALGLGVARGMGPASRWPQTFDAVFHLNAVYRVLRSGDGSSLTLGTLVHPGAARSFYPGAWHDLVAVTASTTGLPIAVSANAVALVVAAVAWPLGCVAVTRVALGARAVPLAGSGVLAAGVTASPVVLTSYGTLWPNALGTALLPAALALLADLVGLGPRRALSPPVALVLLGVTVVGLGLAHPNAVVSLLVLGAPAVLVGTWARGRRWRVASVAGSALVGWAVLFSPLFDSTRGTSWPARERWPQALGEWLVLAPQRVPVPLLVAGLALAGCVVAWRRTRLRWLLTAHVVAGGLFVLVAGSDGRLSRLVSGAWWDDPFRLAALAGVTGVPLAAVGLDALVDVVGRWMPGARHRGRAPLVAAGALAALAVASGGLYAPETAHVVGTWYRAESMLDPAQQRLVASLAAQVPAGQRVVGSPWDGAALTGPLAGREAVFPHLVGDWGPDRELLASSLSSAATEPEVCAALHRLRVGYALTGPGRFWSGDPRRRLYDGLAVAGHPGFEAVQTSDGLTLWRITACRG